MFTLQKMADEETRITLKQALLAMFAVLVAIVVLVVIGVLLMRTSQRKPMAMPAAASVPVLDKPEESARATTSMRVKALLHPQ